MANGRELLVLSLVLALTALSSTLHAFKFKAPDIQWGEYWETARFYSGIGDQCTFVDKPALVVREYLQTHLRAQTRALETVVAAIEAWEFSRVSAVDRSPLVLAITGPTGTGKTEMSNLLAEALFKRQKKLPNSEKRVPSGLLMLRGEDFSDNFTNPITEYHTQIKTRLAEHLHHCSGKAVVVIDEVQKVIPHTLDVLMEAVSAQARFTYYKNGVSKNIDTSNVIFILVSDIGVADMEQVMMHYADRSEDELMVELQKAVKLALDAQWKRLNFGKMVDKVVPFLPFGRPEIEEIIQLKLEQLDVNYRGLYWRSLWIETQIPAYFSGLRFIHYQERSAVVNNKKIERIFARYGARNVETGPIQLLKAKLLRYLRPFNPEAEVRITLSPDTQEITIVSCLFNVQDKTHTEAEPKQDFVELSCVTKWQGMLE